MIVSCQHYARYAVVEQVAWTEAEAGFLVEAASAQAGVMLATHAGILHLQGLFFLLPAEYDDVFIFLVASTCHGSERQRVSLFETDP